MPLPGDNLSYGKFHTHNVSTVTWRETHHILTATSLGSEMWVTPTFSVFQIFSMIVHFT